MGTIKESIASNKPKEPNPPPPEGLGEVRKRNKYLKKKNNIIAMSKINLYSHSGFKFGVIGLGLILTMIIVTLLRDTFNSSIISIIIGLLTIGAGIAAIIGLVKSLKGIKEPNTIKKIIGIIINFGIVALFVSILIANIIDLYRTLN